MATFVQAAGVLLWHSARPKEVYLRANDSHMIEPTIASPPSAAVLWGGGSEGEKGVFRVERRLRARAPRGFTQPRGRNLALPRKCTFIHC